MGRKNRSQRRKKGNEDGFDNHDDDAVDVLSENHTVAESLMTFEGFDEEEDEDLSVEELISTGSAAASTPTASASRHGKLLECLAQARDLVGEKRSAKREAGLRRLFRGLTQYGTIYSIHTILDAQQTLVQVCTTGLRTSSQPAEQYAACRVLEALAVVLGADHDDYVESIQRHLLRAIQMTSRAPVVRGAALCALCMAHYICASGNANDDDSNDGVQTEDLLDLCEAVASPQYRNQDVPPTLRATALECWALLSTLVHDVYISGTSDTHIGRGLVLLSRLLECLESSSFELKYAAGQCMSIIHECRLDLGQDEGENTTTRQYAQGSWEDTEWYDTIAEIQTIMVNLSQQSGHYMSKRAKKQLRATFREFAATVVDDEPPRETVVFCGGSLTLSSYKEIVPLHFCRHCLQGGFQIQLLTNPTLHAIFGADGRILANARASQLSSLEKRLLLSKTSGAAKAAHLDMTKKRRVRTNVKNYFLTADGDEF